MAKRKDPTLTPAEERAVVQWSKQVRLEVLACRSFGHSWTHGLTTIYQIEGNYVRSLGCSRCGMIRRDVTPIGEYGVTRRNYVRPADYSRDRSDEGSIRVPRWAVHEGIISKSLSLEPPADIIDWFHKREAS